MGKNTIEQDITEVGPGGLQGLKGINQTPTAEEADAAMERLSLGMKGYYNPKGYGELYHRNVR